MGGCAGAFGSGRIEMTVGKAIALAALVCAWLLASAWTLDADAQQPPAGLQILAESDGDDDFDDDIYLANWPSVDDFLSNTGFQQRRTDFAIAPNFSTTGLHIADDGTLYVLAESDGDDDFDDDIYLANWPSVDDFLSNTGFQQRRTDFAIAPNFSTTGLHIADDGTLYVLAESDGDDDFDDDIYLANWPSVDDFLSNTGFQQRRTDFAIAPNFSTTGLHIADDGTLYVLAESDGDDDFDDDIYLANWPSVDDFLSNTGFQQRRTDFAIAPNFSTTGLSIGPLSIDSDGDGVPDDEDQCPGEDDTIDVDSDGIPDCIDPLIDSDGDGVPDDEDQCPGEDDTIDVDSDGIPDCIDPLIDSDGDGVSDDEDQCPGTALPDDPTKRLGPNRYRTTTDGFVDSDGVVIATLSETGGCSTSQIVAAASLGKGHLRFGISASALADWIEQVG